jgi:hypothetical protein
MTELYRIYQKEKKDRDENDRLIQMGFSMALRNVIHKELSNLKPVDDRIYHYIFVVPTEWEHGIRDEMIRPMFHEAGLIEK